MQWVDRQMVILFSVPYRIYITYICNLKKKNFFLLSSFAFSFSVFPLFPFLFTGDKNRRGLRSIRGKLKTERTRESECGLTPTSLPLPWYFCIILSFYLVAVSNNISEACEETISFLFLSPPLIS
ncbi:hypothetical protein F4810DRAFT_79632 [Camillea tinctor]|nr:hypothetical protein F4810DRAFT_79632 [Camillea tinctor]